MRDRGDSSLHEATHAVVALALDRRVRWARLERRPIDGRSDLFEFGAVSIERDDLDLRDLVICLAPGLVEPIAADSGAADFGVWPPLYSTLGLDTEGDRRQVSALVRLLDIDEQTYDDVVRETRELLADPLIASWLARTAARLERRGRLTGEEIEALRPTRRTKETVPA